MQKNQQKGKTAELNDSLKKQNTRGSPICQSQDTGCSGTAPDSLNPEDGRLGPQPQRYAGRRIKNKEGNL